MMLHHNPSSSWPPSAPPTVTPELSKHKWFSQLSNNNIEANFAEMTTTSAPTPFSKHTGQHAKEQLTPVTAQHIDGASSTDTNQQALIVAGMSKSDQRSTAAIQGREGALSPTDTAAVSASKRVGTIPKAREKRSGSNAELGRPTREAVSSNALTQRSGKSRRSEDTVRQANLPNDTATHSRHNMSHHDSNLRHSSTPAQPQGRQPQVEDGTTSKSGNGGISKVVSHPSSHGIRRPATSEGPLPNVVPSLSGSPTTLPPSTPSLKVTTKPPRPRHLRSLPPGGASTTPPATSSTGGVTQLRLQCPPAESVPRGQDDDDCVQPSIDTNLQQGPTIEGSSARFGSKHSLVQEDTIEINEKGKDLARRCWEEDKEFLAKDKITEWLSEQKPVNRIALRHYFQFFDFTGLRLDVAFRELCKKLYLKAEGQQLDRILDEFGRRYWECNPTSVFGSAVVAYVVSYSLLMLNTDLHLVKSTKRMSRDQFVRNAMDTVRKNLSLSTSLPLIFEGSLRTNDSTTTLTTTPPVSPLEASSEKRERPGSLFRADTLPRANVSGAPNGQESTCGTPVSIVVEDKWRRQIKRTLKDIYDATKREQISLDSTNVALSPAPASDEDPTDTKKPIGFASNLTSMASLFDEDDQQSVKSHQVISEDSAVADEALALLGAPWAKEGILSHRHYKESPEKGTKSETWVEVFAVAQKGELLMFKFGSHSAESDGPVGGGEWWKNAQPVGRLQLAHSIAQARPPPGYTNQRSNCMALTVADGSVYFFQAGTEALMNEWVSTCNYWAARRSKEPLSGGDSNMEYGWSRVSSMEQDRASISSKPSVRTFWIRGLPRTERTIIRDWKPPMSSQVTSKRDEDGQLEAMKNHVSVLEAKLEEHFKLRQPMIEFHGSRSGSSAKAQDNWQKRANYLQVEVVKYRLYAESLQSATGLRSEKLRQQE